jgi:hypothetical protein
MSDLKYLYRVLYIAFLNKFEIVDIFLFFTNLAIKSQIY